VAIEAVLDEVLRLPAGERAELAARILDSLEDSDVIEPGHEAAWTEVIERRLREAREDRTKLTDMGEAMLRVRAAVAAQRH
jgi:putative addiction module component (TIGR02574 family)